MGKIIDSVVVAIVSVALPTMAGAAEPNLDADRGGVVRIGAVAYAPSAVTIFDGLQRYLNENDFASDYVLYSNYDSLVAALERGEVEIAWNTPLAHAKFHVRNDCRSQTLVMRDVDFDVRSVLVARADAQIRSLDDLVGKRLILGSEQAAEATVLPLHFLDRMGVDLSEAQVVSLDQEVDSQGNPCASPGHVLQALREGRGEAGIITAELWEQVANGAADESQLRHIWTSPPFSHCVFTAADNFDRRLAARFIRLMSEMKPTDPSTAQVMRLEGTKQWRPGKSEGFDALVQALQER